MSGKSGRATAALVAVVEGSIVEHESFDLFGRLRTTGAPALPDGAAGLTGQSGSVANASAVATLVSAAARRAYISGFQVTGGGATAASLILVTVTGTIGGTLTYVIAVPAGVTLGIVPLIVNFPSPIPASADNTNIVVTAAAFGAGNTSAAVNANGFLI